MDLGAGIRKLTLGALAVSTLFAAGNGRRAAGHRERWVGRRHHHHQRKATSAAASEVWRRDQGNRQGFHALGGRRASCRPKARLTCSSS